MPEVVHAVAYLRCSSERQAVKESSIPAQRADIERRSKQDGAVVVRWFEDDGISGKNVEERPGMNAMLDWISAHKGEVQRLYCYDGKRMARNKAEMFAIRMDLRKAKVQLVALSQPAVEDEAANAILESVWDGIAEAERIQLAKVVRRGQRQTLVDGYWPYNKVPYGYRRIGVANSRGATRQKLVVDPEQAEVVRRVYALYVAGDGQRGVASKLTDEGVKPPSRVDLEKSRDIGWRSKHVHNIVCDPTYYGAVSWDDEVINETHHDGIVSKETWEQAQKLAKARRRMPREETETSLRSMNSGKEHGLFRPWLKCGTCGGSMILNRGGTPKNRVWYYACRTRQENKSACTGLTVRADALDEAILTTIETAILTPDRVRAIIEDAIQMMMQDAGGELRERRKVLEARVKDLSTRLGRLAQAIADGSMELQDVSTLSAPLRKQREEARGELEALPEPKPVPTVDEVNPEAFRQRILGSWRANDIAVRRKAMDRIVNEIRLEPGKATIRYSWKVEPDAYTYQEPLGPSKGYRRVYEATCHLNGIQVPRYRAA